MDEKLINDIHACILEYDILKLQTDLKGGQMGVSVFMALYSRWKGCEQSSIMSMHLIAESVKSMRSKNCICLLNGNMGVVWGMRYLALHNLLEEDDLVVNLYQDIGKACEYYGVQSPLYFIEEEPLFSSGIYVAQLFVREETLIRYFREERLIELVDECEKMITITIDGIYSPNSMPLSMLHSILFFLKEMHRERIFPFLVDKLLQVIPRLYAEIKNKNMLDEYIYSFLVGRDYVFMKEKLDTLYLVELIGDIGFYSLLYHCPELFGLFWKRLEMEVPASLEKAQKIVIEAKVSVDTLCGWGYGLLCNIESHYG